MAGGSDLVAPDDHRAGMAGSDRLGLGNCEAHGPLGGVFPRNMILGDLRPDGLEREPETLQ